MQIVVPFLGIVDVGTKYWYTIFVCADFVKHQVWLSFILLCKFTKEVLIKCIFFTAELKFAHKDNLAVYNHTIAMTLVEYASAVSYASNLISKG